MKTPYLIQRCMLSEQTGGKLRYDYMGSSEFEHGCQQESLKRIFAKGMGWSSVTIKGVAGKEVTVYMVAGGDFAYADYQPYLQQLSDAHLRLKEWTHFDDAVKVELGIAASKHETNVWFDVENDVLWTLTKNKRKALVSVLEGIKKKWAEKK